MRSRSFAMDVVSVCVPCVRSSQAVLEISLSATVRPLPASSAEAAALRVTFLPFRSHVAIAEADPGPLCGSEILPPPASRQEEGDQGHLAAFPDWVVMSFEVRESGCIACPAAEAPTGRKSIWPARAADRPRSPGSIPVAPHP